MDSFAPVLGMTMMVFGLIMLVVCLGVLAYFYWPRSERDPGRNRANHGAIPDDQSGEGRL